MRSFLFNLFFFSPTRQQHAIVESGCRCCRVLPVVVPRVVVLEVVLSCVLLLPSCRFLFAVDSLSLVTVLQSCSFVFLAVLIK